MSDDVRADAREALELWSRTPGVEIEIVTGMTKAKDAYLAAPELVDRLLAELDRVTSQRDQAIELGGDIDVLASASLRTIENQRNAAQRERDEARRLLGLDVQEVLTEVDAMRGRLTRRIEELSEESERRRVESFGKERAEAERDAALATLQQVRDLADDLDARADAIAEANPEHVIHIEQARQHAAMIRATLAGGDDQ